MSPAPTHRARRRRTVLMAMAASTAAMATVAAGPPGWAGAPAGDPASRAPGAPVTGCCRIWATAVTTSARTTSATPTGPGPR
ncbi:hypothetical protein [Streptomyces violaceusniger]|uniref:hypothetical protein n=1 Tax=Streptomyces violaceusniger TaxID=68280 RepID=UPI003802A375